MLYRLISSRHLLTFMLFFGLALTVDITPSVAKNYYENSSAVQVFTDNALPPFEIGWDEGEKAGATSAAIQPIAALRRLPTPERQHKVQLHLRPETPRRNFYTAHTYTPNAPTMPTWRTLRPLRLNLTPRAPLGTSHLVAATNSTQMMDSLRAGLEETVHARVAEKMNEGRRGRQSAAATSEAPIYNTTIETLPLLPPVLPGVRNRPTYASTQSAGTLKPPMLPGAKKTDRPLFSAPHSAVAMTNPQDQVVAPWAETAAGHCADKAMPWVRSCADAGYPAEFNGEIRGETRIVCASSEMRDVWLSNNCAPGGTSSTMDHGQGVVRTVALTIKSPDEEQKSEVAEIVRVDGACGAANGTLTATMPNESLCQNGFATVLSGAGPWRWSCLGRSGGMTVSCAASASPEAAVASLSNRSPINGTCGASDQLGMVQAPIVGLCTAGDASAISGHGPWNWACSGANGGRAVVCQALVKEDGKCGPAMGAPNGELPVAGLCTTGTPGKVTSDGKVWNWACSGKNGGVQTACIAPKQNPGQCGPAAQSGHINAPDRDLCVVGALSAVEGSGPWRWTCAGENGGTVVNCTAPVTVNAQCGVAHGMLTSQAPTKDLCGHGQASAVEGNGPWEWSCLGQDGGMTVSCAAPIGEDPVAKVSAPQPVAAAKDVNLHAVSVKNMHRPASETFGADLPDAVPQIPVESEALIPASLETDASVSANTMCGRVANGSAVTAPVNELCAKGTASTVSGDGPWYWTCTDEDEKAESCSTRLPTLAECGPMHGRALLAFPLQGLCNAGSPSPVRGDGPWNWTCDGGSGGTRVQCSASSDNAMKPLPLHGSMSAKAATHSKDGQHQGKKKGKKAKKSKVAKKNSGKTKSGAKHQIKAVVSDTDKKLVTGPQRGDGVCGDAVINPHRTVPTLSLCHAGEPEHMNGNGPWAWICRGADKSVTCVAQAQMQEKQPMPVDGACGAATKVESTAMPANGLCAAGLPSQVSGTGPWAWTCGGVNGGLAVTCTAQMASQPRPPAPDAPKLHGSCGSADGIYATTQPTESLCTIGVISNMRGTGPWNWDCVGANGGDSANCSAQKSPMNNVPQANQPFGKERPAANIDNLVTPQLPNGALLPLEAPAMLPAPPPMLQMPNLDRPLPKIPSNDLMPGTDDYTPAPPVRAPGTVKSRQAIIIRLVDPNHASIRFTPGSEVMNETAGAVIMALGKRLADNPGEQVTVTAYADLRSSGNDTREARRLSLARALTVRDTLLANGATDDQVKIRAQGANISSGNPDRVDLADR